MAKKSQRSIKMIDKKLGYYICNGREFESKIQAYLYASETNSPVEWIFNNDVFNAVKWTQEPQASLDTLYDRRARALRERYDYIILSYSGGSDSNNVLMSFYRQGLHIDEIVTNWVLEATKNFNVLDTEITSAWNCNAEYELHTRDRLQWITDNMPATKITFFDCSRSVIDYFRNVQDESWVLDHKDPINPVVAQRFNYLNMKDVHNRIDHYKSIAIITGTDKPRFYMNKNKEGYMYFTDVHTNIIPASQHFTDYTNTTVEHFYWSPESCDILVKQAHLILQYLNQNPQYTPIFVRQAILDRSAQEILLKRIIYSTTWDNTWFQTKKPTADWDCELDQWFTQQFDGTRIKRNWEAGLNFLTDRIDISLLNPRNNNRGLRVHESTSWFIGKLN
jgi:hypothetical protein